jgi:uncharacterized membrane protein (DUF485 family)
MPIRFWHIVFARSALEYSPGVSMHDHRPQPKEAFDPVTAARNSRVGLILFSVYLVLYGVFVGTNAFAPTWMEQNAFGGMNVAVAYGFVLIIAALILALVYGWLVRNAASSPPSNSIPPTSTPETRCQKDSQ